MGLSNLQRDDSKPWGRGLALIILLLKLEEKMKTGFRTGRNVARPRQGV